MVLRWANHKSYHDKGVNKCIMSDHLLSCHVGEQAQDFINITILEECSMPEVAREKDTQ